MSTCVSNLLANKSVTYIASRHATLRGVFRNTCINCVVQDLKLNLPIINEKILTHEINELQATSANIDYDLIVGRPAVKELKN